MSVVGTYDVVLVGGGACGATTAYFLRQEGVSVALVDKGVVGREASWASAGMIGAESSPQRDPWFLAATTLSKELYDQLDEDLFDQTGRRIGYGGKGHLVFAANENDLEEIKKEVAYQQSHGIKAQLLTTDEALAREPALSKEIVAAAWMPGGRFLDARTYTATVAEAARLNGAQVLEGWQASGLVWGEDRVLGVRSGDDELHCSIVVNASGAWAGRLDPKLTHPVTPSHGQIMSLIGPPCGLRHNVSRANAWGYVTPRADGRVVVGATHDHWGYQKKITPDGMGYLAQIVANVLPCLQGQPLVDVWSGLRPGTPDGLVTVGPDPRAGEGYLWAAGHASSGMTQMPATAKVVTDLVVGREPRIPIDQLGIERYFGNEIPGNQNVIPRFMSI